MTTLSPTVATCSVRLRLADEGRGREQDNPRNERSHEGIQQDFGEGAGHFTLPVRLPFTRAAHFRALQQHGQKVNSLGLSR